MNITLIGMPGAGKSAIGKELAKRLDYTFLDVDEIIEKRTGLRLQQIIDDMGDDRFMEIEEKEILGLGKLNRSIISPGGSAVYSPLAIGFLKKQSAVVFLDSPLRIIKDRIPDLPARGIVGLKKKGMESLFSERLKLYRKYADVTVSMREGMDIDCAVKDIISRVYSNR